MSASAASSRPPPGDVLPGTLADTVVREALVGTGIDLVASCEIAAYDARAPADLRSAVLLPGARALVVAGSAGPLLWRRFRARVDECPERWDDPHPYDAFVAETLTLADDALARENMPFVRFEAAFHAPVRVDFVALARLVGLGAPAPFPLLIHPEHGPWWALRGAWLVNAAASSPLPLRPACEGCPAPCIVGRGREAARPTPEVRRRCVVGQGSTYDADQIAYHEDRAATVARLRRGSNGG